MSVTIGDMPDEDSANITAIALPVTVTDLNISWIGTHSDTFRWLQRVRLPPALRVLTMPEYWDQPNPFDHLPDSITQLHICSTSTDVNDWPSVWPAELRTLRCGSVTAVPTAPTPIHSHSAHTAQ